eukprot:gnl/MRDRNA2_/MRDRNA2_163118_c0_seq1.p1 gnl/MRDRNA2_/MRDRNA2_163118_c0~~gnl/MRDRNA2_/MRDRNA2_163118_c0_seq1.p1  ORF type:complete len:219 (+),score=49.50 gnl/MRDRNA2_/MRDRNA2_163118_c0_seq1:51-659(+)
MSAAPCAAKLAKCLNDDDDEVRQKAAETLSGLGDAAIPYLPAMAQLLAKDQNFIRSASEGFLQFMNNATSCALQKPSSVKVVKKRKAEVIELADDDSESEMTDIENHIGDDELGASLWHALGGQQQVNSEPQNIGSPDSGVSLPQAPDGQVLSDTRLDHIGIHGSENSSAKTGSKNSPVKTDSQSVNHRSQASHAAIDLTLD